MNKNSEHFSKFRPEEDRAVPIFPFHEILMISDGFKLPALDSQSDLEEVTLNLGLGGLSVLVGGLRGKEAQ